VCGVIGFSFFFYVLECVGEEDIKREFTVAAHEKATLAYLRIKLF